MTEGRKIQMRLHNEPVNETVRLIAFETDAESGKQTIADIVEVSSERLLIKEFLRMCKTFNRITFEKKEMAK